MANTKGNQQVVLICTYKFTCTHIYIYLNKEATNLKSWKGTERVEWIAVDVHKVLMYEMLTK